MSDAYLGEVRLFAGNFAPNGWAFCVGQLLPIASNNALFSLLGTAYGGDGTTTFALPDMRGRAPLQAGQGNGLTLRKVGESGGESSVALTLQALPSHNHQALGVAAAGSTNIPTGGYWAEWPPGGHHGTQSPLYTAAAPDSAMSPSALSSAGVGQPHNNRQPYLGVNFIICLQGAVPNHI